MRTERRGSALILVLVSAIVLGLLVGALYALFEANTRTQAWADERIQARFTAEAGLNMAVHMIMEGADVPQGDNPIQFLPETGDWHYLGEDMGWVQVWVDPHSRNDEVSSANAYEVRCLSKVMSEDQPYSYGIASMVLPQNFAVYATFLNHGGGGYYGDGYRFDGPFHSNEAVWLSSQSAGRMDDPWFYSLSIVEDYYMYYNPSTGGLEVATTPQYKNLYIEPYERMLLGEPYFVLGADSIPFGADEVNWEGAYNAANSGGLVLYPADGARMILKNDTLLVKEGPGITAEVHDLSALSNPVVWIDNGPTETVYLKTEEELSGTGDFREHGLPNDMGLTIGVNGNLSVSGPILYKDIDLTDPDNDGMLGFVVVEGNFTVAYDPDMWGGADWPDLGWHISTDDTDYNQLEVDAVVMVLDGVFQLEDVMTVPYHTWPHPAIDLEIVGGVIINEEGITTWESSFGTYGYLSFITYDPRLMSMHPPYFPQTGEWDTAYWEERPDMSDDPGAGSNWIGWNRI